MLSQMIEIFDVHQSVSLSLSATGAVAASVYHDHHHHCSCSRRRRRSCCCYQYQHHMCMNVCAYACTLHVRIRACRLDLSAVGVLRAVRPYGHLKAMGLQATEKTTSTSP